MAKRKPRESKVKGTCEAQVKLLSRLQNEAVRAGDKERAVAYQKDLLPWIAKLEKQDDARERFESEIGADLTTARTAIETMNNTRQLRPDQRLAKTLDWTARTLRFEANDPACQPDDVMDRLRRYLQGDETSAVVQTVEQFFLPEQIQIMRAIRTVLV